MINRGGRPKLDATDSSVGVHVRLPARQLDVALRTAQEDQITVAEVLRRALQGRLKDSDQK